ncbi:aspartyl protease AED3 [Daucus carota subsp. sativus]|uniref:aspartyl protease AED3 n=1 Tax=Daucus carota subsp. sativus TaxID=79200 RepID=UPI0007EF5403|nr:PREDICTED: aspartyl protease AED3-like [Daucus carota subsp. sativus]
MKASNPLVLFNIIFCTFALICISTTQGQVCNKPQKGSTLQVFHVFSPCSPFRPQKSISWEESVLQMQSEDKTRLLYLSSLAVAKKQVVPIASGRGLIQSPTYIVRALVGTPPQTFLMAVDTSSDAAWVPCSGCIGCPSSTFASEQSTSFKTLGCEAPQCKQVLNPTTCTATACSFNTTYGGSTVAANLSQDSLKLATDIIPSYTFGCIQQTTGNSVPPQGLLGLGRGPLSLLSQTQSLYQSTFSYCLPGYKSLNFSGSLRLGPTGQPIRIKYTPLLKNPRRSSLYYVNLLGIRVGPKIVDIPASAFAFDPATGAGTIFDSGTTFTRLVQAAYIPVRDEFRRRMGKTAIVSSLGGFDTCYTVPVTIPTMTFMFSGMNVTLPQDNFLIHSSSGSTTCLAMAAAPDNVNSVLNVIANLQQQNHRVLFDVPNSRLGVSRETCT